MTWGVIRQVNAIDDTLWGRESHVKKVEIGLAVSVTNGSACQMPETVKRVKRYSTPLIALLTYELNCLFSSIVHFIATIQMSLPIMVYLISDRVPSVSSISFTIRKGGN
jgi:hypothetical protein